MPTSTLVIWFYIWQNRLIHPHARKVFRSKKFVFKPLPRAIQIDVEALIRKIEIGEDINPHLSKRIAHGFRPEKGRKNLGRRLDLDLLLNEWGVHHLHPAQAINADGFSERSDDLVFAVFREQAAYVIDLGTHGSFNDQALAGTMHRSWPNAHFSIS